MLAGFGVAAAVVLSGVLAFSLLGNPFSTETKDRTPPLLLTALNDLSEYHAAEAQFEVLVDLEEDVKWVPSALAGERVFFIGVGHMDAIVDFSQLDGDHVIVSEDGRSVKIVLPEATYGEAVVDPDKSHVAARKRGLLDRIGGVFTDSPTNDAKLFSLAEDKMYEAAVETELKERAEANTEAMLTGLLKSLGFEEIEVVFEPAVPVG
jgi:Protein of unknown function (DUF4230)